jgi:hypothetical protein
VKASASHIDLDPTDFGGHSLRAGFVTSAADGSASEVAIMEQTGHRATSSYATTWAVDACSTTTLPP